MSEPLDLDPSREQVLDNRQIRSVMMVRLGGQEYPLETDPKCSVCNSIYREQIEQSIIGGRVFSKITQSLPEGTGIITAAIKRHSDLHLLEANAHLRKKLEKRAIARGANIERGEQDLVDELALAEAVVQKTYEAVASGVLKPKLIDGLRAAKLLADYSVDEGTNTDDLAEAFVEYMDAAAKTMSPEQFAEFNDRLNQNSKLQTLIEKAERDQEQVAQDS